MQPRLAGNHIVAIVVALCVAFVLTPVGVYAAGTVAKTRIVDAKSANRAAKVDSGGRLLTNVTGNVSVSGTVSARPAPPTTPLHVEAGVAPATSTIVGTPIPKGKSIAIGSVHMMWTNAGGWTQVLVRKAELNGTCLNTGTPVMTVANVRIGGEVNVGTEFPVPLIVPATDRALCFGVESAMTGQIIITGYTF